MAVENARFENDGVKVGKETTEFELIRRTETTLILVCGERVVIDDVPFGLREGESEELKAHLTEAMRDAYKVVPTDRPVIGPVGKVDQKGDPMWQFRKPIAPAITAFIVLGCASSQDLSSAPMPAESHEPPLPVAKLGEPVLAVFLEDHAKLDAPLLEVAVWTDGRFVWRAKPRNPDCPLSYGRANAVDIEQLFNILAKAGVFHSDFRRAHFGPDSSFVSIEIHTASGVVVLSSWHERFEENPKLVATAHGITSLDGRTREQARADNPKAYRDFRDAWTAVRDALKEWQPKSGSPYDGPIPTRTR